MISNDHDLLAQAQSGTGKTGAYLIGLLQRIDPKVKHTQALVLAPTRELVEQIHSVVEALSKYTNTTARALMGGTSVQRDLAALRAGVQVIVGTPGRVLDLLDRGALRHKDITTFVLDEADEMLSVGFREAIHTIFKRLPTNVKCGIFSATFPPEAHEIAAKFLRDPIRIVVPIEKLSLVGIEQFYVDCEQNRFKLDVLCDLYETLSISQTIVFVNTRRTGDWLCDAMRAREFPVALIHASMPPVERSKILADFRHGASRVLISTDLLCRGFDVQGVSVVINFEIPREAERYLHRVGRSGRLGRKGVAISLAVGDEHRGLASFQDLLHIEIGELPSDVANRF